MSRKTKRSLKLPIFLMIGPALGIVLSIFLYAIVNFIFSTVTPEPLSSSDTSLAGGASIAQGAESAADLNSDSSMVRTISNVVLFLLGAISVMSFVPCLVVGIVMLSNRRNSGVEEASVESSKESRKWGDLE